MSSRSPPASALSSASWRAGACERKQRQDLDQESVATAELAIALEDVGVERTRLGGGDGCPPRRRRRPPGSGAASAGLRSASLRSPACQAVGEAADRERLQQIVVHAGGLPDVGRAPATCAVSATTGVRGSSSSLLVAADLARRRKAVQLRHAAVHEHDVEAAVAAGLDRLGAVLDRACSATPSRVRTSRATSRLTGLSSATSTRSRGQRRIGGNRRLSSRRALSRRSFRIRRRARSFAHVAAT